MYVDFLLQVNLPANLLDMNLKASKYPQGTVTTAAHSQKGV